MSVVLFSPQELVSACNALIHAIHEKDRYTWGYVYLLRSRNNIFKIGSTNDLPKRLSENYRSWNHVQPFEVEWVIYTEDYHTLEFDLHRKFQAKRARGKRERPGDWFALSPADVDYIKSL